MTPRRFQLFDSLRGIAMILMAVYHFSFDLNYFGLISQDMNGDWRWLAFRAVIMSLFTGLVGVGLYLGNASYNSKSYWMRMLRIGACAVVISIATYVQFAETWVFFGVLHFIFIASLLSPLLIRSPLLMLPAGIAITALPFYYRDMYYIQPGWILTGLSPIKPHTEDFAPFAPWLGVVLLGVFIGWAAKKYSPEIALFEWRPLSRLGHHSLLFYMVHQVILFPIAWALAKSLN